MTTIYRSRGGQTCLWWVFQKTWASSCTNSKGHLQFLARLSLFSFQIPNSQLSILKLLKYQLSLISTTLSKIHEFFSNNTPTKESAQAITLIPSPSQATVIRLQNQLLEATKKDIWSIQCPYVLHLKNKTYLLWIVTYWASVDIVWHIWDAWRVTKNYLVERKQDWKVKKNPEDVEVVNTSGKWTMSLEQPRCL